ncbi:MAG: hypothetical protein H6625_07730 [Bdellovibrionaceae bacterium]|nr:hypothetical protein [Pseudobdellovibrionaceae bacterium]
MRQSRYKTQLLIGLSLVFTFFGASTLAQGKKDASKKRTSINFEDELVQGEVQKPELLYLLQKKQFNFKRLIKLRKNFLPEMRRTAEDMQPLGSDH